MQGPGLIEVDEKDLEETETCCPVHEKEDQEEGTDHLLDRCGVVWGELNELGDERQRVWGENEGEPNGLGEVRQGVWEQLEGLREEGWGETEWEPVSGEEDLPQWWN